MFDFRFRFKKICPEKGKCVDQQEPSSKTSESKKTLPRNKRLQFS